MDAHKDKAIKQKYSAALMSNSKWKKFFLVMSEFGSDLGGLKYHFTDTDNILSSYAPSSTQVWDGAIDDSVVGPIEYKHIESIFIPFMYEYRQYKKAPLSKIKQDIEGFISALNKIGQFPIKRTDNGIVIYGYN